MKGDVFQTDALVFAKIRGYPAWPAKITAALDESKKPKKYSVFFFGTYEVATVKVEDLFAYDEKTKAKFGSANVKRKGFAEAMQEIEESPDMEVKVPLPPLVKTPATPRSGLSSAAATPSSTPKPRGRGRKRKEDSSTPVSPAAAAAAAQAEMAYATSAPGGKRRRMNSEGESVAASTPAAQPTEPVLSRSGRQIKPKRFADDEGKKKSPAAAKRAARAAAAAAAAEAGSDADGDDLELMPEKEEPLDVEEAEEEQEDMQVEDAAGAGGDGPAVVADTAPPPAPEEPRRDVRYKLYPAHETEDIIRVVDSADVQNTDGRKVMYVRAKCGELLEIDISDRERPKEFKSEKARIMWDTATSINLRRLRHSIEQGHCIPDRLREKLLARADLADDMRENLKMEKKRDTRKSKLWWLRDEARLIEIDYHIKMNLIIDQQNHEKCAECFRELIVMSMAPLMLKKNPDIVETTRKCRKYTHSSEIRELADKAYKRFKKLFVVPPGKMFREYFDEQVAIFRKLTEDMEEYKVIGLVRDPLYKRPGEVDSDSDDDIWPPGVPKGKLPYRRNGSEGGSTGAPSPAPASDAPAPPEQNVTIPAEQRAEMTPQDVPEESTDTDVGVEDIGGKTIPASEEEETVPEAGDTSVEAADTGAEAMDAADVTYAAETADDAAETADDAADAADDAAVTADDAAETAGEVTDAGESTDAGAEQEQELATEDSTAAAEDTSMDATEQESAEEQPAQEAAEEVTAAGPEEAAAASSEEEPAPAAAAEGLPDTEDTTNDEVAEASSEEKAAEEEAVEEAVEEEAAVQDSEPAAE